MIDQIVLDAFDSAAKHRASAIHCCAMALQTAAFASYVAGGDADEIQAATLAAAQVLHDAIDAVTELTGGEP